MRRFALVLVLAAALAPAAAAAASARPLSGETLLSIDRSAGFRNFLPTRMLPGFTYTAWSYRSGTLRIAFSNKGGWVVQWKVSPMTGACDAGKQASYQLDGNKVWWAQGTTAQAAWRCVFGQDGKPLRLEASSTTPPSKLAGSGLGVVAASATRY
jgi:hypothetical protein